MSSSPGQYQENYLGSGIRCSPPINGGGHGSEVKCDAQSFRKRFSENNSEKSASVEDVQNRDVALMVGIPASAGIGAAFLPALGFIKKFLKFRFLI